MDQLEFEITVRCNETESDDAETRGRIKIDDDQVEDISLIGAETKTYKFSTELSEGDHTLQIDHVYSPDPRSALEITKIVVDEIDLGVLAYNGTYTPTYPEPWYSDEVTAGRRPKEHIGLGQDGSACMFMGWEGTYKLTFNTPLYEWLLENI